MVVSKFLTYSIVYYFLPKLALYLPLCWMAVCFWWADRARDASEQEPPSHIPAENDAPVKPQCWYESAVGSRDARGLPGDWL